MIKLKYRWDLKNFLKASKEANDYEYRHSIKRYIGWFFIALTQFGVVATIKQGSVGLLLISTILVLYWYFFRWKLREAVIKKSFSKLKDVEFIVTIDEDSIKINDSKLLWEQIEKVVNLESGFMLSFNREYLFLPKSAFSSLEEIEEFIKLAKAKSNYTKAQLESNLKAKR